MSILARSAVKACLASALALPAAAQLGSELFTFHAAGSEDNFGQAVAVCGDVDGDLVPDYAVGAYLDDAGGNDAGRVFVYSGATGLELFAFPGDAAGDQLGFSVAGAGDVDGDGRADVLAGANTGSYARVWSGASGAVLHTFVGDTDDDEFGAAVAGLGDLDGDERADVAVGAPAADGVGGAGSADAGRVRVFSGATGAVLRELVGEIAGEGLGRALADAGRVDGDLLHELVAGTSGGSYLARVYAGLDGAVLHTFFGDSNLDWFGTSVAGPGDVDGDGADDVVVGAPQAFLGPGYVRVFSGATGAVIRQHSGQAFLDLFGWSVGAAGDVDHDGRRDVLVGAPFFDGGAGFNSGRLRVFSGATGALLTQAEGDEVDGSLGWSVAGALCADAIAGAPLSGPGGRARVIDTDQAALPESYCVALPNSTGNPALMSWLGTTSVSANSFTLVASGAPNGAIGIFFRAQAAGETPFGNGNLCTTGPVVRLGVAIASGGTATRGMNLANLLPGQVRYAQYWYRNPAGGGAGFNLSDGLRVPLCD
jgi:hypothetical protein